MTSLPPDQLEHAADRNPRQAPRRWKPVLGVLALSLILIVGSSIAFNRYTDPQRIRAIAEAYLERSINGMVKIGSASCSLAGDIRLYDVALCSRSFESACQKPASSRSRLGKERVRRSFGTHSKPPETESAFVLPGVDTYPEGGKKDPADNTPSAGPLFSCREVRLTADWWSLLTGALRIKSITAIEPTCTIVRDRLGGQTNLSGFLRSSNIPGRGSTADLPMIELRDAHLSVMSRESDGVRTVDELTLTIRARSSHGNPHLYDVVWQADGRHPAEGYSQIDLDAGCLRNVRGGLPWMSIEAVMLAVDAGYDGTRAWCDLLGLNGTVRVKDYNLCAGPDAAAARSATIELDDASISIPIDETEHHLPPGQRYLRFEEVGGEVRLRRDGVHAEFTGLFHGSECTVSADLKGSVEQLAILDNISFEARLAVTDLGIPRPGSDGPESEKRFINHWRALANFYRDYDPHGVVDLNIELAKGPGPGTPTVLRRAVFTAKGGNASCRYMPYRAYNVTGSVEYAPDGVVIRELRGEHGGGIVTVSGHLTEPNRRAAKEITISATGIPIDEELRSALPDRYRKIVDQFKPKGMIDVFARLEQPASTESSPAEWKWRSTIQLRDVSAVYAGFPYPVDHLTGTIRVDADGLEVVEVTGRSDQARVEMEGAIAFGNGSVTALDLTVSAEDILFDPVLDSALPGDIRDAISPFHPEGFFDATTRLSMNEETKRVLYKAQVALKGVAVRHDRFPVEVSDITGRLDIEPGKITVDGLTGGYQGAVVSAEGFISPLGRFDTVELTVRSQGLVLDDALCEVLPPNMRRLVDEWRIDGPIATETVIRADPSIDNGSADIRTVARLSGGSLKHASLPAVLRDVEAEITIDKEGLRTDDIRARYGQATLRADLDCRIPTGSRSSEDGTIKLNVTGLVLDRSLCALLPERMAAVWERLQPSGVIDLHIDSLHYKRPGADAPREWHVEGYVDLNDVSLPGVAGAGRMFGSLIGSGFIVDERGATTLNGSLGLSSVEMLGQRFTHMESAWSFAHGGEGEDLLVLDSLRGQINDGSVAAKVEVAFHNRRTRYDLSVTAHGVQIEPFVLAEHASRRLEGRPPTASGLAYGHLYLSGVAGDPPRKRGGGRLEIRDGHIYRLPIILAILHVLDLSIPDEDAFEEAGADFYILGDRIQLEDIVLRGSVLALIGSGSMTLPDRAVDLNLVNVSPHRWARIPVLADFVERASRELVELHVTGPLSRPKVRARPLRSITDEFKRLFQKRKPKNKRPQPAPS